MCYRGAYFVQNNTLFITFLKAREDELYLEHKQLDPITYLARS